MKIDFVAYGIAQPAGSKTIARSGNKSWVRDAAGKSRPWKTTVSQYAGVAMQGKGLMDGPLYVSITFHQPRPKGHFGAKGLRPSAPAYPTTKPDVLKLARAVEDAMTGIVYRDDALIVKEELVKVYGEPARVEVTVAEILPPG